MCVSLALLWSLGLCQPTAAVAPTFSPTPGHYHVLYRGYGETQMGWHGETYCLVGGYRAYGDAPLATPAKMEVENPLPTPAKMEVDQPVLTPAKMEVDQPVPSRAPKRRRALAESDKDLGCSSPKIRRVQHSRRRLTPRKLAKAFRKEGNRLTA